MMSSASQWYMWLWLRAVGLVECGGGGACMLLKYAMRAGRTAVPLLAKTDSKADESSGTFAIQYVGWI